MMMKKKFMLGLLSAFLLTGCSDNIDIESMSPPELETAYEKMNDYIRENSKDIKLLDFEYMDNRDNGVLFDLDSDGVEEGLIVYKDTGEMENIHFNILKLDGEEYRRELDVVFPGGQVTKIDFQDMDMDGNMEIAIAHRGSISDGFNYYEYQDNDIRVLQRSMYRDWFFADLNDDGKKEFYAFDRGDRYKDESGQWLDKDFDDIDTRIEMYKLEDDEMILTDECNIEELTNGVMWSREGKITDNKKGIFLGNGIGNASYTSLLMFDDSGKLFDFYYNPESKINEDTFGKFSVPARDIDNDNIMEFAIAQMSKGDEDVSMSEVVWIDKWYKWDEKERKKYVKSTHYSYFLKTLYHIPENIDSRLKIDGYGNSDSEVYLDYFYKDDNSEEKLFSLYSPVYMGKNDLLESDAREVEIDGQKFILKVYENSHGISYESVISNIEIVKE